MKDFPGDRLLSCTMFDVLSLFKHELYFVGLP